MRPLPAPHLAIRLGLVVLLLALAPAALAESTNTLTLRTDLPDVGASAIRALGALAMVLAMFFGGVWLFRNGQRLAWRKTGVPKLAVLESRALGNRYALHIVGYEKQRLLIGSSPAGITLLSQLPEAATMAVTVAPTPEPAAPAMPFAEYLQQLLKGNLKGIK